LFERIRGRGKDSWGLAGGTGTDLQKSKTPWELRDSVGGGAPRKTEGAPSVRTGTISEKRRAWVIGDHAGKQPGFRKCTRKTNTKERGKDNSQKGHEIWGAGLAEGRTTDLKNQPLGKMWSHPSTLKRERGPFWGKKKNKTSERGGKLLTEPRPSSTAGSANLHNE